MLSTSNKSEASRLAGCSRMAIWRWLRQREFCEALQSARIKALTGWEGDGPVVEARAILQALTAAGADRLGYWGLLENCRRELAAGEAGIDLLRDLRRAALTFESRIAQAGFRVDLIVKITRRNF